MATIIDKFITWLTYDADTKGIKQSEKAMHALEKQTEKVNEVMETLKRGMEFLGAAFAIDKIVEWVNEWDVATNKLKSVGFAGQQLVGIQQQILDISDKTGTKMEANAELYQQLSVSLGSAASNAQKLKVMDTLTKIFAINGTSTAQSEAAIGDMSRALEGSTVRYMEIKRAMQDVPGLMNVVRRHFKMMGTTYTEALKGNTFSTAKFVQILVDANKHVTDMFSKMQKTIPMAMTAMGNNFSYFFGELGDTSGIRQMLVGWIYSVANGLKSLGNYFSKHAQTVKEWGQVILAGLGVLTARFALFGLSVAASMAPMILSFGLLALAIQDLYVWFEGGNSVIGGFLEKLGETPKKAKKQLSTFFSWFKSSLKSLFGVFKSTFSMMQNIIIGLVSWLEFLSEVIWGFIKGIGDLLSSIGLTKQRFNELLGFVDKYIKKFNQATGATHKLGEIFKFILGLGMVAFFGKLTMSVVKLLSKWTGITAMLKAIKKLTGFGKSEITKPVAKATEAAAGDAAESEIGGGLLGGISMVARKLLVGGTGIELMLHPVTLGNSTRFSNMAATLHQGAINAGMQLQGIPSYVASSNYNKAVNNMRSSSSNNTNHLSVNVNVSHTNASAQDIANYTIKAVQEHHAQMYRSTALNYANGTKR